MPSNTKIGRGFDFVSPIYDLCVRLAFGNTLNELQSQALSNISKANHCLIIGGGTGQVLRTCIDLEIANQYHYAELSERMIFKARARLKKSEGLSVLFSDTWKSTETQFDLVILPFVLDCYNEVDVQQTLIDLSKKLSPNGKILIVDFNEEQIDGFTPQWWQKLFIKILYSFFVSVSGLRNNSLPQFFKIAGQSGLELINRLDRKSGWIQASLWQIRS